jgi:predicted ATP-grasp superfamily ATP-dependent carboligase
MADVLWSASPRLRDPIMVCAFKGWNDAGEAASAALGFIHGHFDSTEVASIDPEEFYDFTAVRPTVRLVDGSTREIDWPENVVSTAEIPGAEGDLVMLRGTEPSLRWRRFTEDVVETARKLDVRMVITLGALLADVPHSRPVSVTGIASDQSLMERLGFDRPSYQGPTGIVGVLHHACAAAGLPSASLWASVPHYVAAAPNPKVALALVRAFEGAAGVAVDAGELEEAADDYERQVSAAVASDPEVKAFVERLESAMDEVEASEEENLPSADTIAQDFQRFLRQRGPGSPGSAG